MADYNGKLLYNFNPINTRIIKESGMELFTPLLNDELISSGPHMKQSEKYDKINDIGKLPLRGILEKNGHDSLVGKQKLGFNVNTINLWKNHGHNLCKEFLNDSRIVKDGWINDDWIQKYIDSSTAVVMLSHINYKTGRISDMKKITDYAHQQGALVVWDLSHSVGVIPMDLHNIGVDFAVGCTYKHLNGGPGAPGFLYVHSDLIAIVSQPLSGWLGHSDPFAFEAKYTPANNINKFICGTPSILSYKAVESALDIFDEISLEQVREKSIQLSELFIKLIQQECGDFGFELFSPIDAAHRGSQISYKHENAYPIMQSLISRGIIGDYREPNILRFGISPLYMRYEDVWSAIICLKNIMQSNEWDSSNFKIRNYVT